MLQASEPLATELIKLVGVPLAQVLGILWFLKKYVIPPTPTEEQQKAALAEMTVNVTAKLASQLEVAFDANEKHQDLVRTEHFDQLRRDLSTTIEKATENAIMRYLWETERRRKT